MSQSRVYCVLVAKGSAKTTARTKKIRKRTGAYLDALAFKEHAKPRPVTVTYVDPEQLRRHIQETAKK